MNYVRLITVKDERGHRLLPVLKKFLALERSIVQGLSEYLSPEALQCELNYLCAVAQQDYIVRTLKVKLLFLWLSPAPTSGRPNHSFCRPSFTARLKWESCWTLAWPWCTALQHLEDLQTLSSYSILQPATPQCNLLDWLKGCANVREHNDLWLLGNKTVLRKMSEGKDLIGASMTIANSILYPASLFFKPFTISWRSKHEPLWRFWY